MNVFGFKTNNLKTQFFGEKGGCNKTFFLSTCVLQNVKSYRFFAPFLPNVGWCSKNTIKKQKNEKKIHFEVLLSGPSRCYYLGQVDCNLKMANLAQIITPQICARMFYQKSAEAPICIVFFDKQCFVKNNLAQIITPQKTKLGPDNNTTATYIYIYTVESNLVQK